MSRKTGIILGILILAALATAFIFFHKTSGSQMSGFITEVKADSITVKGVVKYVNSTDKNQVSKTIVFMIGSQTVFKKQDVIMTWEQLRSNKPPTLKDGPGNIADLKVPMRIIRISSEDNLFNVNSTIAKEVYYAHDIFPTSPQ